MNWLEKDQNWDVAFFLPMTALTISTGIPTSINTLERLIVWSGFSLATINPTLGVLETSDRAEKVAQAAIFQAADDTYRVLVRACIPINPNYMSDRTQKIWMFANDVSNVAIPAAFSAN